MAQRRRNLVSNLIIPVSVTIVNMEGTLNHEAAAVPEAMQDDGMLILFTLSE
jgi:hypothetical protein